MELAGYEFQTVDQSKLNTLPRQRGFVVLEDKNDNLCLIDPVLNIREKVQHVMDGKVGTVFKGRYGKEASKHLNVHWIPSTSSDNPDDIKRKHQFFIRQLGKRNILDHEGSKVNTKHRIVVLTHKASGYYMIMVTADPVDKSAPLIKRINGFSELTHQVTNLPMKFFSEMYVNLTVDDFDKEEPLKDIVGFSTAKELAAKIAYEKGTDKLITERIVPKKEWLLYQQCLNKKG